MSTPEQENSQRQTLGKALSELTAIKPEELVREDELGRQLSFAAGLGFFKRTLLLFREITKIDLNTLPFSRLLALTNVANQALGQFKQVREFSVVGQQNPTQARDALINQIRDSYDGLFDAASPTIAYAVKKGTDFERLEDQAKASVDRINVLAREQEAVLTKAVKDIEGTLTAVRRAAEEVGVAQHATHFRDEADQHKRAATKWLYCTTVLAAGAVVLAIAAVVEFYKHLPLLSSAQSIQLAVLKLVVFSIIFSGLIASGRIYRAHRHNYVINRHRQNALSTFETFAKATSDESTKNAVLLQATQRIFSLQPTGYVYQESDGTGGPALWELIPGFMGQIRR